MIYPCDNEIALRKNSRYVEPLSLLYCSCLCYFHISDNVIIHVISQENYPRLVPRVLVPRV